MTKIVYALALTILFVACGAKKTFKDGEIQMEVSNQDAYRNSFEKEMGMTMEKLGATNVKVEEFKVLLKKNVTDTKIPLVFDALEPGDSTIQVVRIVSKISYNDPKTSRDTANTGTFDMYYNLKNQLIIPNRNRNQISLDFSEKLFLK